ncbi:MAG: hypothetical protein KAZ26_20040 [Caldilineaceae bacterium]|nr:hypothetical protein [Caldilineaceae bacterium]
MPDFFRWLLYLALAVVAGGIVIVATKALAGYKAAADRRDEAWHKFTWGDWV